MELVHSKSFTPFMEIVSRAFYLTRKLHFTIDSFIGFFKEWVNGQVIERFIFDTELIHIPIQRLLILLKWILHLGN